jgi:septum formation protein
MMNINHIKQVVLASQSPRRVSILKQMGIDCVVMPADIDETAKLYESPSDYVLRLAAQKAQAIVSKLTHHSSPEFNLPDLSMPILAADTTVALSLQILGKPEHDVDAFHMLKKLSGSTHQVHTAIAVAFNGKLETAINSTQVEMMPLSDAMISEYIASGEHKDKAGSYAIQGLAGCWIKKITGSYTGVMGLPLYETGLLLNKIGAKN